MTEPWGNGTDQTHLMYCPICKKPTVAVHKGSSVQYFDDDPEFKLILATCNSCTSPFVFRVDISQDSGYWVEGDPYRVLPAQARELGQEIPPVLRSEQNEARKCFEVQAYTATVVMVRRTIEGVCAEHSVKERTLAQSLRKMEEGKLLDARLLEWAQELRALGNEGAHFTGKLVPREDAEDALAFAEALLDYVYVLTAKFNEFKTRRASSASMSP